MGFHVEYVYFILEGEVQLNKKVSNSEINLVKLSQGETFGLDIK